MLPVFFVIDIGFLVYVFLIALNTLNKINSIYLQIIKKEMPLDKNLKPRIKTEATEEKEPNNKQNEIFRARRNFILGGVSAAVLLSLGIKPSHAETSEKEITQKLLTALEKNPESILHNPELMDFMITFLFSDAIYHVARTEGRNDPENDELKSFPKNGLSTHIFSSVFPEMKNLDKEFPHSNLILILTSLIAKFSLEKNIHKKDLKENPNKHFHSEVLHTLQETGMGVSMLLIFTSYGKNIKIQDQKALNIQQKRDQEGIDKAESDAEKLGNNIEAIPEKLEIFEDELAELIGASPVAAALTQIPSLAFGNAAMAREKFLMAKKIMADIFQLFQGLSFKEIFSQVEKIKNPKIKEILKKQLSTEKNSEILISQEHIDKMTSTYFKNVFSGEMMAYTDITQCAGGDVGPAFVAQLQNWGQTETLKSFPVLIIYSLIAAEHETNHLARRLGIERSKLINKRSHAEALGYMLRTWTNFIYMMGASAAKIGTVTSSSIINLIDGEGSVGNRISEGFKNGMNFKVPDPFENAPGFQVGPGMLEDASNLFQTIFKAGSKKSKLTLSTDSIKEILDDMNHATAEAISNGIQNGEARAEGISAILGHTPNPDETEAIKKIQETLKSFNENKIKIDPQIQQLTHDVEDFTLVFKSMLADNPNNTEIDLEERLEYLTHLLKKKPHWAKIFSFTHWHHILGPELAETAWIVFLQGLGVQSLNNTMRAIAFGKKAFKDLPLNAQHAAIALETNELSKFADNWAGALLSGSQEFFDVAYPGLLKDFKFSSADIPIEALTSEKLLGKLSQKFSSLENILEKKLKKIGRSDEVEKMKQQIKQRKAVAKYISTIFAVRGGGFTTIGNSPHFIILVQQIAKDITLLDTLKDHFGRNKFQTGQRLAMDFTFALLMAPKMEKYIEDHDGIFPSLKALINIKS